MSKTFTKILTIAGSDSGGGAGIQADLKTFSALECYGMSAITALTAQNTMAIEGVFQVPAEFVKAQIDMVFDDLGADAVKIGMLNTSDIILTVSECLMMHAAKNIVLDPVMISKSGDPLLKRSAINALKETLIPIASIITPNIPEAEVLLEHSIESLKDMEKAAFDLKHLGAQAVLIKGGHATSDTSTDCLLTTDDHIHWLESPRISSKNTHGTGCTLSSAIASYLGKGQSLKDAVTKSKNYISLSIEAAKDIQLGKGHGPVHHFFNFW